MRTSTRWGTLSSGASGEAAALTGSLETCPGAGIGWITACTASTITTGMTGITTNMETAGRISGIMTGIGTGLPETGSRGITRRRVVRRTVLREGGALLAMTGQSIRAAMGRSITTTAKPR